MGDAGGIDQARLQAPLTALAGAYFPIDSFAMESLWMDSGWSPLPFPQQPATGPYGVYHKILFCPHLSYINVPWALRAISGLSLLFQWAVCLFIFCINHQGLVRVLRTGETNLSLFLSSALFFSLFFFFLFCFRVLLDCAYLLIFSEFACLFVKEGSSLGHLGRLH